MDNEEMYDLIFEAVTQALDEHAGNDDMRLSRRLVGGRILFEDDQGREAKAIPVLSLFKKVTAVRERLRVLEQKLNNHSTLSEADKAELQAYVTRCYGSLTTFNFLFAEESDKFKGTGG